MAELLFGILFSDNEMFDLYEKIITAIEDYGYWFLTVFIIGIVIGVVIELKINLF